MTTITRHQFDLLCTSIRHELLPGVTADAVVRRQLANAEIEVEKSDTERLGALIREVADWHKDPNPVPGELDALLRKQLPEAFPDA